MMLRLKIEGMTCEDCARRVEDAVRGVPGVSRARVDYPAGEAAIDRTAAGSDADVLRAVEGAGYRARVVAGRGAPDSALVNGADGEDGAVTDLLVIGSGAAGMAAAIRGAELGARVAIVEDGTVGGTCVNVGCIPSKNLIRAAERYHGARRGFPGVGATRPALDWAGVRDQKTELVEDLRQAKYMDVLDAYPEVRLIRGRARLNGDGRVEVDGAPERARGVVVATGTAPALPPIPGLDAVDALDSTTAMELDELPDSLIVLGGGAVGLELGQTFARLGVRVTILEARSEILDGEDTEMSTALRGFLEDEGIAVHTGAAAEAVERDGAEIIVRANTGAGRREFRGERILVATGRRANTSGMGLEGAGVTLDPHGFVQASAELRTSNPAVYAAGDVTGGPGYVYVAAAAGRVAAENALTGAGRTLDLRTVPRVTFTSPQVAAVGVSELEAREAGRAVEVARLDLADVPRALVNRDARGRIKLVAEEGTGRLLGVHAVAPDAGELMGEATLAVRLGLTIDDIADTMHPYLTWTEALRLAAQTFTTDVAKLSCCA